MRLRLDYGLVVSAALAALVTLVSTIVADLDVKWRVAAAVAVGACLVFAYSRARFFVYIRSLVSGMEDWHEAQGDVPAVGRQPDPRLCVDVPHDPSPSPDKVVDHTATVDGIVDALKASTSGARVPLRIGPNMMWELAISLGYDLRDLPRARDLELAEFLLPNRRDTLVWSLTTRVQHGVEPTVRAERARGSGSLVIADLTVQDAATTPNYPYASRYRVAVFRDDGTDVDAPRRTVYVSEQPRTDEGHAVVSPWSAVRVLGETVRTAVHETESGPVFLAVRLPKTVAVALGHYLRTNQCPVPGCRRRQCEQPWSVLVPLHYDRSAGDYYPWRTNRNQPPAADMAVMVKGV